MKRILIITLFISFSSAFSQSLLANFDRLRQQQIAVNTPIANVDSPVLYNFRIEDTTPNRVLFDASEAITANSITGFTISNRTITSVTIDTDSLGGYFTVSSPFTFWDNNTIRYDGGSDFEDVANNPLLKFTLEYITNNIPEPTNSGTVKYLDVAATGTGDGNSEVNAYTDFKVAITALSNGGTLYIKAGIYRVTDHGDFYATGTVSNPIKIIGYKNTPNDITSNYYNLTPGQDAPSLDPSEMPVIEGNKLSKYGLWASGNEYIIIKNLQFNALLRGITGGGGNVIVERCNSKNMYGTGRIEGGGFVLGSNNTGNGYTEATNYRIKDSYSLNAGLSNILVYGSNNLITNVKTYCDNTANGEPYESSRHGSDYHIELRGSNNIVKDSDLRAKNNAINNASHGVALKGGTNVGSPDADYNSPVEYNLVDNVYVKTGSQEGFQFRNKAVKYNVVKNSTVEGFGGGSLNDGGGLVFQTGAQNNIYENMKVFNCAYAIVLKCGTESGSDLANRTTANNEIRNSFFYNNQHLLQSFISNDFNSAFNNNKVINSTFSNHTYMMRGDESSNTFMTFSGNEFINCIIDDVNIVNRDADKPQLNEMWSFSSTAYNNLSFSLPNGTGLISVPPNFIDFIDFVPQNTALNVGLNLLDYDYNKTQRRKDNTSTIGAIQID